MYQEKQVCYKFDASGKALIRFIPNSKLHSLVRVGAINNFRRFNFIMK